MSNISDEAALGSHDLIHNAEVEEQKAHGDHALTQPDYGEGQEGVGAQSTSTEGQPQQQQEPQKQQKQEKQGKHHSTLDKVKEALHMKK